MQENQWPLPDNTDTEYMLKTDSQTIYYMAEKINSGGGKSGGSRAFRSFDDASNWLGGMPGRITDQCSIAYGVPMPSEKSITINANHKRK